MNKIAVKITGGPQVLELVNSESPSIHGWIVVDVEATGRELHRRLSENR